MQSQEINLRIETTEGSWDKPFAKTEKISGVIAAVIDHFGFAKDGKYDLRLSDNPDEALDPNRPLVSYGIKDGTVLIFADLGIAV